MVDKMITIHEQWHPILGKEIPLIELIHYVKKLTIFCHHRNCQQIEDEDKELSDEELSDEEESTTDESQVLEKNQLSRLDCIASSLLASAECTVAQDIFRTLSQFPIAFPLVMPELDKAGKFRVMFPSFVGPIIKWETKPGTIIENHLFNDPFQLIVTV
ncbi:hypothetical protein RhiirA5_419078 [Rhizophagus irregularis]|uniref:Uncharacterized protein n=1 Tax=Rhizophagus irregularis TaxID=588596 RepID=A0A2I1FN74_9GLOM|nr:hypothetical protein RhiirA5_419078 [Rhizophagus irregularis]PKC70426.1 hypothetical protein RhiirA1_454764 [Rhizophagus irregularis]PKY35839.1 hypothetical protein RhiirB3_457326 [Rhizophagus irregularis]